MKVYTLLVYENGNKIWNAETDLYLIYYAYGNIWSRLGIEYPSLFESRK